MHLKRVNNPQKRMDPKPVALSCDADSGGFGYHVQPEENPNEGPIQAKDKKQQAA